MSNGSEAVGAIENRYDVVEERRYFPSNPFNSCLKRLQHGALGALIEPGLLPELVEVQFQIDFRLPAISSQLIDLFDETSGRLHRCGRKRGNQLRDTGWCRLRVFLVILADLDQCVHQRETAGDGSDHGAGRWVEHPNPL